MFLKLTTEKLKTTSPSFISKIKYILILGIGIVLIILLINSQKVLIISHQETGEIYCSVNVKTGDKVTYEWIHSFEHIPWYEDFYITDQNHLYLEEIRVAGFGAGIPENKGRVSIENGMVVMREIGEDYDHIQWLNSQTALQFIAVNDQVVVRGDEMPHHEPLALEIKGRVIQWLSHLMP